MKKSRRKHNAIRFTINCAMEFSKNKNISNDFRKGLSLKKIAEKYEVNQLFDLRPEQNYAKNIVRFALLGNKNEILGPVYNGLMREDEFKRYAKEHMQKRWEDAGNETYLEGRGIHGRTVEERIEDSLNGVKSRNQEPWDDKEIILAKILSEFDEYQHRNKRSNKKIATALNQIYHSNEIRTAEAVSYIFRQRMRDISLLMEDEDLVNEVKTTYFP